MSQLERFLTTAEEQEIVAAIRTAERNTSGEIRVHLEGHSDVNPYDRATQLFEILKMNNTKESNGVLIYVAVEDKRLAILGDSGIDSVVPDNFWESTKNTILNHFKAGEIKQGLIDGVLMAGEQLKTHFPYSSDDQNELPDSISTS